MIFLVVHFGTDFYTHSVDARPSFSYNPSQDDIEYICKDWHQRFEVKRVSWYNITYVVDNSVKVWEERHPLRTMVVLNEKARKTPKAF